MDTSVRPGLAEEVMQSDFHHSMQGVCIRGVRSNLAITASSRFVDTTGDVLRRTNKCYYIPRSATSQRSNVAQGHDTGTTAANRQPTPSLIGNYAQDATRRIINSDCTVTSAAALRHRFGNVDSKTTPLIDPVNKCILPHVETADNSAVIPKSHDSTYKPHTSHLSLPPAF